MIACTTSKVTDNKGRKFDRNFNLLEKKKERVHPGRLTGQRTKRCKTEIDRLKPKTQTRPPPVRPSSFLSSYLQERTDHDRILPRFERRD